MKNFEAERRKHFFNPYIEQNMQKINRKYTIEEKNEHRFKALQVRAV